MRRLSSQRAFREQLEIGDACDIKNAVRIVLIAAKQLAFAKTRLAEALPANAERAMLAEAMFRDVLAAALSARRADEVAVVTSDATLTALATSAGAVVIDEGHPRGLNIAVRMATTALSMRGATSVCTLLSDTPLITAEDIDEVFDSIPTCESGVVLVPSRDLSGTNIIARKPPGVIPTQFGRFSLLRHLDDCRTRGIAHRVLRLARPAIDLDVPSDLIEFARSPSMTNTFGHLTRLGMVQG